MRHSPHAEVQTYLDMLFARTRGDRYVEVRARRADGGMNQQFFSAVALGRAATAILTLGARTDVYVGVAPRIRRAGGRRDVDHVSVLWADCDGAEPCTALESFTPAPTMIVRSSASGVHAYWALSDPLNVQSAEAANRGLALALGADLQSTDAARILRPPGTFNFKYRPPDEVRLVRATGEAFVTSDFGGDRLMPPEPVDPQPLTRSGSDPLRTIEPAVFIKVLTGIDVRAGTKIRCPFHDDATPSLHVYDSPEGGWYCFGCGRGTSIYDFAAALWRCGTRGREFVDLRTRLLAHFGYSNEPRGNTSARGELEHRLPAGTRWTQSPKASSSARP